MDTMPRTWARYEDAKPGTLKLSVPDYRMEALERDYRQMYEMLYGDIPNFSTIIEAIKELEDEINQVMM